MFNIMKSVRWSVSGARLASSGSILLNWLVVVSQNQQQQQGSFLLQ